MLPIFSSDQIKYILWQTATDSNLLQLRYNQDKQNHRHFLDLLYRHHNLICNSQTLSTKLTNGSIKYLRSFINHFERYTIINHLPLVLNFVALTICAYCFNLRQNPPNLCPTPTDQVPLQQQLPSTHFLKRKSTCHIFH